MGVAATVIYDDGKVDERYGLRPDQMLDYKALKGDTSDNIPGVPGVGEKTAISLLQQFGSLDAIYEHLDEVKGKLRDRLAEHRESAFLSRQVGRIVTDLPVELDLESARTGRYDRRAVAQRFRELEFRSLIDRLPPSSIAPSGPEAADRETRGGLQLSLDLLGGAAVSDGAPGPDDGSSPPQAPDPLVDPGGAIEHVDPAHRAFHGRSHGAGATGWRPAPRPWGSAGPWVPGRPLERRPAGDRHGRRPTVWRGTCPGTTMRGRMTPSRPGLAGTIARSSGHDLKQLLVSLGFRGMMLGGPAFDTLVASLHAQPIAPVADDRRPGGQRASPPSCRRDPTAAETGAEERSVARRAAGEALTALLVRPALESELAEAGLANLFREVEMPLLPVLARMELAGRRDRPRGAGRHGDRVRRAARGAGGPDLHRGRPPVQHRLTQAARADPLPRAGAAGHEADAHRATRPTHRSSRSCATSTRWSGSSWSIARSRSSSRRTSTRCRCCIGADGRLHTTYQQAVAATGRLSSIDPNLQNIPVRTALGPAHPARLRGAAGEAAAGRRLLAAGAADPGPRLRRRGPEGGLCRARGHPPRRRGPRPGPGAGRGGPPRSAAWPR